MLYVPRPHWHQGTDENMGKLQLLQCVVMITRNQQAAVLTLRSVPTLTAGDATDRLARVSTAR